MTWFRHDRSKSIEKEKLFIEGEKKICARRFFTTLNDISCALKRIFTTPQDISCALKLKFSLREIFSILKIASKRGCDRSLTLNRRKCQRFKPNIHAITRGIQKLRESVKSFDKSYVRELIFKTL